MDQRTQTSRSFAKTTELLRGTQFAEIIQCEIVSYEGHVATVTINGGSTQIDVQAAYDVTLGEGWAAYLLTIGQADALIIATVASA